MSDCEDMILHMMRPGCFYRIRDIAAEKGVPYGTAWRAVRSLVRGG